MTSTQSYARHDLGYSLLSKAYDELHGEEQLRKLSIIKAELGIESSDSLLDVGCGTGLSASLGCSVTGVDNCMEMVGKAGHRIKSVLANAESLPFPSKSFDRVICVTAIHNFSDAKSALAEMSRVSRKDVVVSVLKKSKKSALIDSLIRSMLCVNKLIDDPSDSIYFCVAR